MSLKSALLQVKQEKKEKEITAKIQAMIDEQKRLLNEGLDISKDGDIVKVKKEWDASVLNSGGITYRKVNNKWYRVSVVRRNCWIAGTEKIVPCCSRSAGFHQ